MPPAPLSNAHALGAVLAELEFAFDFHDLRYKPLAIDQEHPQFLRFLIGLNLHIL